LLVGASFFLSFPLPSFSADEDFEKTSLALRTALHYDPSVDAPLRQLAELYRKASRLEELLGLYEAHVSQYPQDAGAALVLARLYMEAKDRRTAEYWKTAVAQHPNDAALTWFHAKYLDERHDAKALDEMARAVSLENSPSRRALWFAELMKGAATSGREDLIVAQTKKLLADGSMTPEQRLRWARQAFGVKLRRTAKILLEGLAPESLGADNALEAAMLHAELLAADGNRPEAVKTLDDILGKLAPDHWRHHEVLMLRLDLSDGGGRDSMVKAERDAWQAPGGKTEAHALSLADVLEASHRGHEAFVFLQEALKALPESQNIETRLLESWEREGVSSEALNWLDQLLAKSSGRADLQLRRARWLFIAGKDDDARQGFENLLKSLAPDQRVERSVEMARWLRRRNELPQAASVLEAALALAPDRWDLRRELAEMDFALRRKDEAVKLFDGAWTKNLAPDARLETVQFLISKQLWTEARALLEPWLREQPGAFDGRLLLAKIFDKTGDDSRAVEILEQARALCDTQERYQAWLGACLDFEDAREHTAEWIRNEAARLQPTDSNSWNETTLARWLALVTEARNRHEEKLAGEMLAVASQSARVAPEKKTEMERLRLDLLASEGTNAAEVEKGLRDLMESDAAHREDYRARLVLLYQRAQRTDLARTLLEQLDPSRCTEVDTLRALIVVCRESGLTAQALAASEKLTLLQPGERANWTQRLTLLAESGYESRFRDAVRQVQAKAPDWKLKPDVLELLDAHLMASTWRDVVTQMAGGDPTLAAARRSLDEAKRVDTGSPDQQRWADWISGFLSVKLHDRAAAENAIAKLNALDAQQWIAFPDGLELSVAEGRRWLKDLLDRNARQPRTPAHLAHAAAGPLGPWSLRWGFTLAEGRTLTRVLAPAGASAVFLVDDQRAIYAISRRTGKLLWNTEDRSPPAAARAAPRISIRTTTYRGGYPTRSFNNGQTEIRLPLEVDGTATQLCFLHQGNLECLSTANGSLLWRCSLAEAEEVQPPNAKHENRIAIAGNRAVVWQPDASVVSAYDLRTGRLLWEARVPQRPKAAGNPYNAYYGYDSNARMRSGLSVDANRVFVFSETAAMVNLDSGAMLWRLSDADLPGFPIDLETPENPAPAVGALPPVPQALMPIRFLSSSSSGFIVNGTLRLTGGYQGRGAGATGAGSRWAYGNGFATLLQNSYGTAARLHGDEIWMAAGSNTGLVSVMGLPQRLLQTTGMIAGFAGDLLVSFDGGSVQSQSPSDRGATLTLMSFNDEDPAGNVSAANRPLSVALAGSRVYVYDGVRLRIAEARAGSMLFDTAPPEDLASWVQSLPPAPPPPIPPGYTTATWRTQSPSRSYLPQGVFEQDYRGGGTITGQLAVVADTDWIFPVAENAVACMQGRAEEPAATAPP
jgi:hypothetical protein